MVVEHGHHQPGVEPHFVIIRRGLRRQGRAQTVDIVTLDGDVMHRQSFLRAVAIAAGRAEEEEEEKTPQPGKVEAITKPSREDIETLLRNAEAALKKPSFPATSICSTPVSSMHRSPSSALNYWLAPPIPMDVTIQEVFHGKRGDIMALHSAAIVPGRKLYIIGSRGSVGLRHGLLLSPAFFPVVHSRHRRFYCQEV